MKPLRHSRWYPEKNALKALPYSTVYIGFAPLALFSNFLYFAYSKHQLFSPLIKWLLQGNQ